jgi:hypothetical protein
MSTSLRGAAALPHRRNNSWVALMGSAIYRWLSPGVGAILVGPFLVGAFREGGL